MSFPQRLQVSVFLLMELGKEQFVWCEKAENTSLAAFVVKLVPVYNKTDLLLCATVRTHRRTGLCLSLAEGRSSQKALLVLLKIFEQNLSTAMQHIQQFAVSLELHGRPHVIKAMCQAASSQIIPSKGTGP